uniref:Uncharacterized protein n=1 Tax=Arundo donax TaxID=35708 RepID=A0A0A8Z8G5_ARUDO
MHLNERPHCHKTMQPIPKICHPFE